MKHSTLTTVAIVAALVVPFILTHTASANAHLAITGFEQVTLAPKALPTVVVKPTVVSTPQQPATPGVGGSQTIGIVSVADTASACGIATYNAYGSRTADVLRVQHLLNVHMNAGLPETGFYGVRTVAAVKKFQTVYGIPTTGNQYARTTARMNAIACGDMSFMNFATRGSRGAHVVALQQVLNGTGANLPVTGYYGPRTEAAVRAFQTAHGIPATGNVFTLTRAALMAAIAGTAMDENGMFDIHAPAMQKEGGVRRVPSISVSKTAVTPVGEVAGGVTVDNRGAQVGLYNALAHKDAGVLLTVLLLCVAFLLFMYRKDKAALMMLLVLAFGLQYAAASTRTLAVTGFDQIRLESLYLPFVHSSSTAESGMGGTLENTDCDSACMRLIAARKARAAAGYAAYGDYGTHVAAIQSLLNKYVGETNISLRKTGYFGPATRAAVFAFQKQHGLPQTGNVYAKTLAALGGTAPTPTVAVTNTTVTSAAAPVPTTQAAPSSTEVAPVAGSEKVNISAAPAQSSTTDSTVSAAVPVATQSHTGQTVTLLLSLLALTYFAQQHYKSKQSIA